MKTPKVQEIPLCVETQFPACFQNTFGDGNGKRDPILTVLEENLPNFNSQVGFVLAEVLEIERIRAMAKVFIYSRHETNDQKKKFNDEYFALIDKLFKGRGWSLSSCSNLYFGDGETHKIFCAKMDADSSKRENATKPQWNSEAIQHEFRRDYQQLTAIDPANVDAAWLQYVRDFNDLRQNVDGSLYFYNILVPISLNSPPERPQLRQALGAIFLAFGTNEIVSAEQLMALYCRLQLFWHYNYSAEAAVRLIQRADELEKYRDMYNLLLRPLDQLGKAIHSMQQDVRGLSAVLYEPAEGLFRSHKTLVDLFDDINTIKISKRVELKVRHNSIYSNPTEAALIIALAVWRLFSFNKTSGEDGLVGLDKATTHDNALTIMKTVLVASVHTFISRGQSAIDQGLLESLLFVCFPKATSAQLEDLTLEHLLSEKPISPFEDSVNERVAHLKAVLFSPFKFHTYQWRPRALELALKDFGKPLVVFYESDSTTPTSKWDYTDWLVFHDWTPLGYGAVLDFLMKCCAQYRNRGSSGSLGGVEVKPIRNAIEQREFVIRLHFEGDLFFNTSLDDGKLQRLVNQHVLQFPRDWRVEQVTLGNFQKPFIDLCNKMLGLHDSEESFVTRPTSGWVVQQPTQYDRSDPECQLLLLERPKPMEGESKALTTSRFFELRIGAEAGAAGITLRWFEGPTSDCLKKKNKKI